MHRYNRIHIITLVSAIVLLAGCSESPEQKQSDDVAQHSMPEWVSLFDVDGLLGEPKLVDCVLSGGAEARCVSLTVPAAPTTISLGPWCPRNVSDRVRSMT